MGLGSFQGALQFFVIYNHTYIIALLAGAVFWGARICYDISMPKKESVLVVCSNRKAYHDYFIEDTYEAGLALLGAEVKSVRQKELSLEGSFVRVENGTARVYNMHVKPYKFNSLVELDPTRPRQLLLNKKELRKLAAKAEIKGYSLVPVEVYFKNGWAKIKLAVAKGKHLFDKRESLKKRDLNREMEQHFKNNIRF